MAAWGSSGTAAFDFGSSSRRARRAATGSKISSNLSATAFARAGGTAFATGRGEKVERVPGMALALVLVNPRFASSTAEAYGRLTAAMYSDGARARAVELLSAERTVERRRQG